MIETLLAVATVINGIGIIFNTKSINILRKRVEKSEARPRS